MRNSEVMHDKKVLLKYIINNNNNNNNNDNNKYLQLQAVLSDSPTSRMA
jgi:hypothetical protein